MGQQQLINITLVVRDYDEAIDFYTRKLSFVLVEDTVLLPTKRWVRLRPPGNSSCCLLLGKAATPEQDKSTGNQTGGRVFLFIETDDFRGDYQKLIDHQVTIVRPPRQETYGTVAVFADLYGNLFDLIQPATL